MIQTESAGFSPKADKRLQHDRPQPRSSATGTSSAAGRSQIAGANGTVKTFSGDSSTLPSASLTWDGTDDSNNAAPEGIYTAKPFRGLRGEGPGRHGLQQELCAGPDDPTATLSADPAGFTRGSQGVQGPVTISVNASSPLAKIQSWDVDVFDPDGKLFQSFTGQGSDGKMSWDGKGLSGDWVQPSKTYAALATIRDEFGPEGTARLAIPVADMASRPAGARSRFQPGQSAAQPSLLGFSPRAQRDRSRSESISPSAIPPR